MAYTPKTKKTNQDVDEFLVSVSMTRRDEAYLLIEIMKRASGGEQPTMWGPSMIGFGTYRYVTKSKIEADWFKIGFSPRAAKISLYVSCELDEFNEQLQKLGKYTRGKGCIYVNKLDDIDTTVLENIVHHAHKYAGDFDASK